MISRNCPSRRWKRPLVVQQKHRVAAILREERDLHSLWAGAAELCDIGKVLVTGGAGFIGSHLVPRLLNAGLEVRILDTLSRQIHGDVPRGAVWLEQPGVEFIRGSVLCAQDLAMALAGVDAVAHLAAETGTGQSMYEVARYNEVNSQGSAMIFERLANDRSLKVKRFLLASSRSVYGEGAYVCMACDPAERRCPAARTPTALASGRWEPICESCGQPLAAVATREDDRVLPASVYAATKYAQEDLVRVCCAALGIDYAILRLQNVYGEGQSLNNPYTGILSIFSTRIRRGMHLPIFEDGLETRDFVHAEDVARAFVAALTCPTQSNAVYNVGSGVKTSVSQIASQLCEAFGAAPSLTVTGQYRLGDIRHNWADMTRIRQTLGFVPQIDLGRGLKRFADWALGQPLPEDRLDAANSELKRRRLMG